MPAKRGSRAASKTKTGIIRAEPITDGSATRAEPITGGSATVTIRKPKGDFDLSVLKSRLWDHYSNINYRIKNPHQDGDRDGTIRIINENYNVGITPDNQHKRSAEDEDREHESLKELLVPYANIYDYDYDVKTAKDQFTANERDDDPDRYTSLIWAIKLSSKDNIRDIELMCNLFLKKDENGKTDMNNSILNLDEKGGWNGSTALHKAAEYGRVDVIDFLMTKGADVNCTNEGNYTPLMLAARDGKHEVVEKIIQTSKKNGKELKIEYNVPDQGRFTDLALACNHEFQEHDELGPSYVKVVNLILNDIDDNRARDVIMHANKFGKTPLLIACENGQNEIVKLIIDKMRDLVNNKDLVPKFTKDDFELEINRLSFRSKTALHLAIAFNPNLRDKHSKDTDMTIINMLLKNGAWSDRVEYGGNKDKADHPKYKWQKVYNYIQDNINKSDYEKITEYDDLINGYKDGLRGQSALTVLCSIKNFMNEPRKIAIFKQLKKNAESNDKKATSKGKKSRGDQNEDDDHNEDDDRNEDDDHNVDSKSNEKKTFSKEREEDHNVGQLCTMYPPKYHRVENFELLVEILNCIDKKKQSQLILKKDESGKTCLHKACAKGNIGVISVLIDRIIDSIQTKESDETHCGGKYTKVLATRKFMEMNYLSEKDHSSKSCMDYLREYYKKSDHLRKDVEYLFEVALDGPEHKFYLLEMFPEILNAMPNPSIIMNDEMMEFILKKLFYRQQYSSKDAYFFHYGKYADVALFDTLVNIAVALKHCAREKQMGRQILEKKVKNVSNMIVRCIESQSMDYTSNIADLFRYGLDLREVDANETAMTEETHDVSELRLALTLMSGPLRKCIEYDLLDVLGTAQISPYIERIFTINLKKGQIKPISDTTNLIQIRSHCLYYRYSPIIMFIFECWSKVFFFALVVIVSMNPFDNGSSQSYNYCETLLITYLFGGLMNNFVAVFSEVERRTEMRAREQLSMKVFIAVVIFLGVQSYFSLNKALISTVLYTLFVCLPDLINLLVKKKNYKPFRYGSVCSWISDTYNWSMEFAIKFFRHSFQDPWSFLESISLMLILIWFLHREVSSKGPVVTMLQKNIGVRRAVESLTSLITVGYALISGAIILIYSCFTSMLISIHGIIRFVPLFSHILDFCTNILNWVNIKVPIAMNMFSIITNFISNVSVVTPVQWERFILSFTKITLAFNMLRSMLYVETFGSLTMSLFEMIKDVSAFLVVFVIPFTGFVFAAFSSVGYAPNCYKPESEACNLPEEILNVRKVLQIFLPSDGGKVISDTVEAAVLTIIVVIFQVVIFVVLTNLLIARMTKSYEKIELSAFNKWIASKAKITIDLLLVQEREPARMLPPPFNIITIMISIVEELWGIARETSCEIIDALFRVERLSEFNLEKLNKDRTYSRSITSSMGRGDEHTGSNKSIWNDVRKICSTKYWFPSYVDSSGNPIYFSMTSLVADVVVCLISLPFTPFYEISLLSGEITRAAIPSSIKIILHVSIVVCYPLFYSIYIGVIIKELILRLRTGITRLVSSKDTKTKLSKNKDVFWGTLQTADVSSEDSGGNIYDTIKSMYRGWYKSWGLISFITSIAGNIFNMCTLIEFIYSIKSGRDQPLFSQLLQLLWRWIKMHLVAIVIEFLIVFARGFFVAANSVKASSPELSDDILPRASDAYQPNTRDLKKIKEHNNGSVKIKIERVIVKDPMPLFRGIELSQQIRPYVVVYFGSDGPDLDPKNNQNRRLTKTAHVEKKKGGFIVEPFEELWFKNEKEERSDTTLKFVVWNRHIGDSNDSGKDAEPLYYAKIEADDFQKNWIANGLYLGRVPLKRYGTKQKLDESYVQITFEVKYNKETNLYSANLHRATSNVQKRQNRRRNKTSMNSLDSPRAYSVATASDGNKEKTIDEFDNCQYFEGYNNKVDMFKGCSILMKTETENGAVDTEGTIVDFVPGDDENPDKWKVLWKPNVNTHITMDDFNTHITRDDLLKDDKYKIYKINRRNKDVLDTYQFFRKAERDDIYNKRNDNEKNNELNQD